MSKSVIQQCCLELINKFIDNPNYPREIKIAKKLLYICPDLHSWLALEIPFKINSLAFFLKPESHCYIPISQENPYLLDMDELKPKNAVDLTIK
jgi:hypothetical protein